MPFIPGKKSDVPVEYKPVFERIQDWIFKLDVGIGIGPFRLGMFCLVVLLLILLYTGTQFYGLRDPEAMDAGQLARNLWRGRGYATQNIRPLEIWYLLVDWPSAHRSQHEPSARTLDAANVSDGVGGGVSRLAAGFHGGERRVDDRGGPGGDVDGVVVLSGGDVFDVRAGAGDVRPSGGDDERVPVPVMQSADGIGNCGIAMGIDVGFLFAGGVCGIQGGEMAGGRPDGVVGVRRAGGERGGGGAGDADAIRVRVGAGAVVDLRGGIVSEKLAGEMRAMRDRVSARVDAVDGAELEGVGDVVRVESVPVGGRAGRGNGERDQGGAGTTDVWGRVARRSGCGRRCGGR